MDGELLGKRLTFDSSWNLAGVLVPALVGIALTPVVLSKLGASRFGLLSQIWILCGYAGMFDFGFGMVLTRSVATFHTDGLETKLLVARRLIGLAWWLVGALAIGLAIIWLFGRDLLPQWAKDPEIRASITLLLLLIPVSSISAVYRGVLVGKGQFAKANIARILLGCATFGAPLILVAFAASDPRRISVARVLAVFLALRLLVLLIIVNWAKLPSVVANAAERPAISALLRRELGGSAVMLAMSFLMPLMASVDRAVLTPVVSLATIGGYNIVMDTMMKLLIWPNAVSGVGLHRFSRLEHEPGRDLALFLQLQFQVLVFVVPAIFISILWGPPLLTFWLRVPSSYLNPTVVRLLAVGTLFLAFSQVPSVIFYARKAEIVPLLINVLELPLYFLLLRWSIRSHGLVGLSVVVCGRMVLDCVVFHFLIAARGVQWFRSLKYVATAALILVTIVLLFSLIP